MGKMRILVVGGVAGGASCAARARRLSETAEIIIFDRGDHAGYYPGASPITLKLIFDKADGRILGTQAAAGGSP